MGNLESSCAASSSGLPTTRPRLSDPSSATCGPRTPIATVVASSDGYELVIGSRYVTGGRTESWRAQRRLLSSGTNRHVRRVLDLRTHDATAHFRARRARSPVDIGVLSSDSNGYCCHMDRIWRAERGGARVIELFDRSHSHRTLGARRAV